jgi:hypothetical protein
MREVHATVSAMLMANSDNIRNNGGNDLMLKILNAGKTTANWNYIHNKVKSRLNSGYACRYAFHNTGFIFLSPI